MAIAWYEARSLGQSLIGVDSFAEDWTLWDGTAILFELSDGALFQTDDPLLCRSPDTECGR